MRSKISLLTIKDILIQFCFIFGVGGLARFGGLYVVPYLYHNLGETAVLIVRATGCFLIFQMLINWICIKFVDTSYNPVRDGTKPDGIQMGQVISRIPAADETGPGVVKDNTNSSSVTVNKRSKFANEQPKRTAYPYFSWTPCLWCNRPRPPRCHHCPQCNICVIKRDHHCFFAGRCIGYRNLRHFSVFLFWACVSGIFSSVHAVPYYFSHVIQSTSILDLLFPVAVVRAAVGYICWKFAFFIVLVWILVMFLYIAFSYFQAAVNLIKLGKTTFEAEHKMELTDRRNLAGKLRAVYGHYWVLNFLIPMHSVFEPIDDPLNWPHMKET